LEKAQAILDQGNKLLQDGDAASALKKFEEAKGMVAQDKQWPIWRQIGRAQGKLNMPEAVASFKKSIELAPEDKVSECRNALGQYYLDQKKYDEALDSIIDPKSADSPEKALLGVAKSTMNKEPKMAEAALERVLKLSPDNLDVVFDLGQLYYMDGKEKDSRTKELLTRYVEKGQDAEKLQKSKDMMVIINRRNK
jgi:tetratricopeptide (TPR) repeat protein